MILSISVICGARIAAGNKPGNNLLPALKRLLFNHARIAPVSSFTSHNYIFYLPKISSHILSISSFSIVCFFI